MDESHLFGPQLRLETRYATIPGSRRLTVRDEVVNLKDQPAEFQLLYHWNFGPPFLDEGRASPPRSAAWPRGMPGPQEGVDTHDRYAGPQPGFTEQVYFYDLAGEGAGGPTLAMLRSAAGDKAVVLRFRKDQLPAFTSGRTPPACATATSPGWSRAPTIPTPAPLRKPAAASSPCRPAVVMSPRPSSKSSTAPGKSPRPRPRSASSRRASSRRSISGPWSRSRPPRRAPAREHIKTPPAPACFIQGAYRPPQGISTYKVLAGVVPGEVSDSITRLDGRTVGDGNDPTDGRLVLNGDDADLADVSGLRPRSEKIEDFPGGDPVIRADGGRHVPFLWVNRGDLAFDVARIPPFVEAVSVVGFYGSLPRGEGDGDDRHRDHHPPHREPGSRQGDHRGDPNVR